MLRKVKIAAFFTLVLWLGLFLWQFTKDKIQESVPAPGRRYQVSHGFLHLNCKGNGKTTAILEAGLGSTSLDWTSVQTSLSKSMRVCSYDRLGYGWSSDTDAARTASNMADELSELLEVAEIKGPYILVAHSYGAYVSRILAGRLGKSVQGFVFVEGCHEDQMRDLSAAYSLFVSEQVQLCKKLAPFGIVRLSGAFGMIPIIEILNFLPTPVRQTAQDFFYSSRQCASSEKEMSLFLESGDEVRKLAVTGNTPTVVLSAEPPSLPFKFLPKDVDPVLLSDTWRALQLKLVKSSTSSRQIPVPQASHYLMIDHPDVVVTAVQSLLH